MSFSSLTAVSRLPFHLTINYSNPEGIITLPLLSFSPIHPSAIFQTKAHKIPSVWCIHFAMQNVKLNCLIALRPYGPFWVNFTETRLFKYIENFTSKN